MKRGYWTEIFRAGDYGAKGVYTPADLDAIVANFNAEDKVPVVIGHPKTDSPAWGWLDAVKHQDGVLLGRPGEMHAEFAKALDQRLFKNRSVRIAKTPAGPKLLHLGFLGATLPQVEGLKQVAEFAGDGDCTDYAFTLPDAAGQTGAARDNHEESDMEKDEKIKKLEADLAAEKAARQSEKDAAEKTRATARGSEFARFVTDEMVATGKIATGRTDEVVAFMTSLPDGSQADFSYEDDGAKKTVNQVEWFKSFVRDLPAAEFARALPGDPGRTQQKGQDFGRDDKGQLVDLARHV